MVITFPASIHLVSTTTVSIFFSQIIRQKSVMVPGKGPVGKEREGGREEREGGRGERERERERGERERERGRERER